MGAATPRRRRRAANHGRRRPDHGRVPPRQPQRRRRRRGEGRRHQARHARRQPRRHPVDRERHSWRRGSRSSSGSPRPAATPRAPGTFITLAANLAYMAPGTRIGAASPIDCSGKDIPGTLGEKVKNDAIAWVTSIAEARHRPVDWAVSAPSRTRRSSPANEAVAVGAVDGIATTIEDVVAAANGKTITVSGPAGGPRPRPAPRSRRPRSTRSRASSTCSPTRTSPSSCSRSASTACCSSSRTRTS